MAADAMRPETPALDVACGPRSFYFDKADEHTCCGCRWWSVAEYEKEPTTDLTCGYCRRFPPCCEIIGEDDGHGQRLMGYPMCYAGDDACGEFTSRGW